VQRVHPIRAGSASGNRRNNPHPQETFMVWRFPRQHTPREGDATRKEVSTASASRFYPTNADVERIYAPLKLTTYRRDYEMSANAAEAIRLAQLAGVPYQFLFDDGSRSHSVIDAPHTLNTVHRASYQPHVYTHEILRPSTTRYGCNKNKSSVYAGISM
jgi:hypothetical protein